MQYPNSFFRGPRARLLAASSAAVLIVVGLGAGVMLPHQAAQPAKPQIVHAAMTGPVRAAPPRMLENGAPFSFADLVERVSPAVVTVTVEEQLQPSAGIDPSQLPEPFRDFFNQFGQGGQQQPRKAISMGSGFVIDKSGDIVTNNHVVENGKKITVKFPDGREFDAHLVGTDKATDIAVLKIKTDKPLPSVEFADDRQVRVGDWVIAVGNPFGLSNTVTAGIVSSIGRDIGNGPYTDFIQIDASINRGNSGGPTFDLQGKVIGMNSMIFSPSGGSVGIGFAIPSSTIREIVSQLEQHGHVSRGWLGVSIQAMTPELAASHGLERSQRRDHCLRRARWSGCESGRAPGRRGPRRQRQIRGRQPRPDAPRGDAGGRLDCDLLHRARRPAEERHHHDRCEEGRHASRVERRPEGRRRRRGDG